MNDMEDPFKVCFNMLKLRYKLYDETLTSTSFLIPEDKVNVFISLESVLTYLSQITNIDEKIIAEGEEAFCNIFVANSLNLAAHYKRFFRDAGLATRVFLYMTDICSDKFSLYKYNEDYRSYYLLKYLSNPKFERMGKLLKEKIVKELKTISEFIPNVYTIVTKDMEGSLVPFIVANEDTSYKNLIISTDIYDCQYPYIDEKRFNIHCIRRSIKSLKILYTKEMILSYLFDKEVKTTDKMRFDNTSFFITLLACIGNKARYIEPIAGIGKVSVIKYLTEGIDVEKVITEKTTEVELISMIFPEEIRDIFINNFICSSIPVQYQLLTSTEKMSVLECIVDRSDLNSLMRLNASKFHENQLMLEELTH